MVEIKSDLYGRITESLHEGMEITSPIKGVKYVVSKLTPDRVIFHNVNNPRYKYSFTRRQLKRLEAALQDPVNQTRDGFVPADRIRHHIRQAKSAIYGLLAKTINTRFNPLRFRL